MGRGNGATVEREVAVLDVPVEFGGLSFGAGTCRLGISIDREVNKISLKSADELFSGHRLRGKIALGGNGDAAGQGVLFEDLEHVVESTFDVKGMHVRRKELGIGLTFSSADIDVQELVLFAKEKGRLKILDVGDLPSGHEEAEEEADAEA